ncbi:hypothetical protein [Vibrio pomeroyi]|uniref:hypothetical protein n=1 Tax=Vibrio pomeroyi TaxID=198832 RepID=UPI0021C315D8|nr:hypothetical protein [Vibrio pomeroyi]
MTMSWSELISTVGGQLDDFKTENGYSLLDPIDINAFEAVNAADFSQHVNFKKLQLEKNLSEAISLLDRCTDSRKLAYDIQESFFRTVLSTYKQRKIHEETLKEINKGLFTINHESSKLELETVTQRKVFIEQLIGNYTGSTDTIEYENLRFESETIQAKIELHKSQQILEEVRKSTIEAKYNTELDAQKVINGRMAMDGSPTNYKKRFDSIKEQFDVDLAGAYRRLLSVRDAVTPIYGINFNQQNELSLPDFPNITPTSVDSLDKLKSWTRQLVLVLQQRLISDQDIVIRVSIKNDCTIKKLSTETGGWDPSSIGSGLIQFEMPDNLFSGLDYVRMRGVSVGSSKKSWRVKIEPPSMSVDDDDRSIYLGRVLPFGNDGKGGKDQVFRGSALHNVDPKTGMWKLQVIGNSLDSNSPFSDTEEADFYLDLYLSAIVGEQ